MADTVNLVIYPQIKEGETLAEVKEKLCKTLSVDMATVETWYATDDPTAILRDVDEETASRYASAIQAVGAECNLQPSGEDKSSWALEQMTRDKPMDLFICPSCEHEEEIDQGTSVEKCPKCGLVIASWEEKIREEAEKEKVRRRLLRDQRLNGDQQEEVDARHAELERLRALEREIMKELGIRLPSRLWLFFEKHTISMSLAIFVLIIMAAGVAFRYGDTYFDNLAYKELVAAPPSPEMEAVAPVMAAAVTLQQNGNQQVIFEMADASQLIRGDGGDARQELLAAATQMMKGVEPSKFVAAAGRMSLPSTTARLVAGEIEPARVNIDTIGGVSGLQGVPDFSPGELTTMAPPLLEHGHERVLAVLTEKRLVKDIYDPEGPDIIRDAIDEMDGSAIVVLMSSIARDQEWDQFLASHVERYLVNGDLDAAVELANVIRNPVVRLQALGKIMEEHLLSGDLAELEFLEARVGIEAEKIEDPDTQARALLDLGWTLAGAGSESEPENAIRRVSRLVEAADSPFEKSFLTSRLAVAQMRAGDNIQAKRLLQKSMQLAGQISDLSERITAFTRIAQRYYDVRNNTLASEILAEAAIIAASRLEQQPRSVAFGEIALAQGYMGDFAGARQSIDNAAEGKARQQLIGKLAEMLIGEMRFYEALAWMDTLNDDVQYARLELRLSSALFYAGQTREALNRMEQSAPRMLRIYELSERGLLTSQFARFFARLGREDRAEELFRQATQLSEELKGRKSQVNLALVALDRARVFQLAQAKEMIIEELTDSVVRDPIDAEVIATERIIRNLLPEDLIPEEPDR